MDDVDDVRRLAVDEELEALSQSKPKLLCCSVEVASSRREGRDGEREREGE